MNTDARRPLLQRAEAAGRWVENVFLTVLLVALMSLSSLQIVLRNVFSTGLPWADGVTRLLVLWIAVVGAVAASRDNRHISIDLATRFLPESWHRSVAILVSFFAMTVAGTLTFYAFTFVRDSREFGDIVLDDWPAWIPQLILPIGFGLICYRFALQWIKSARGIK